MYEKYNIKFHKVVPYIGTWIETPAQLSSLNFDDVVPYIGTWIETATLVRSTLQSPRRTLYRYLD